jgi:chromosome segregation ATPase
MKNFKRVLCYASIVIGGIFFVIFLASIVGTWIIRSKVNNVVDDVFTLAIQVVEKPDEMITNTIDRRQKMQEGIANLSSEIERLGTEIENSPIILEAIDQLMGEQLIPTLEQVDQTSQELYANVSKLETTLEFLNLIPFFQEREGLLDSVSKFLNELLAGMDSLDSGFSTLQNNLSEKKSEVIQTAVTTLQQPLEKIDTELEESQTRLSDFQEKLDTIPAELATTQKNITQIVSIITIILTLVLIWLAVSQVMTILYSLGVVKSLSTKTSLPEVHDVVENTPDQ